MLAKEPNPCARVAVWLHLVLDDECGAEERAEVELHLAECEACTRELTLLEKTRAHLRHQSNLQAPEVPARLRERIAEDQRRVAAREELRKASWPLGVAALGVLLVVGGLGVILLTQSESGPDPLVVQSISRHTLDVPVDVASPDVARVESFLRPRIGEPIVVPRLDSIGLGLLGGRVVDVDGQHAAQLTYHSGLGRPLSVTAIPDHAGLLSDRLIHGHRAFHDVSTGFETGATRVGPVLYLVVGDDDGRTVLAVTQHLNR